MHFCLGNGKGVSLFIRLHVMRGSAMAINTAMCHSVRCEQTGRDKGKAEFCDGKYDTISDVGEVSNKLETFQLRCHMM